MTSCPAKAYGTDDTLDQVMMLSGDLGVAPVTTIDGQRVGNGEATRLYKCILLEASGCPVACEQ